MTLRSRPLACLLFLVSIAMSSPGEGGLIPRAYDAVFGYGPQPAYGASYAPYSTYYAPRVTAYPRASYYGPVVRDSFYAPAVTSNVSYGYGGYAPSACCDPCPTVCNPCPTACDPCGNSPCGVSPCATGTCPGGVCDTYYSSSVPADPMPETNGLPQSGTDDSQSDGSAVDEDDPPPLDRGPNTFEEDDSLPRDDFRPSGQSDDAPADDEPPLGTEQEAYKIQQRDPADAEPGTEESEEAADESDDSAGALSDTPDIALRVRVERSRLAVRARYHLPRMARIQPAAERWYATGKTQIASN